MKSKARNMALSATLALSFPVPASAYEVDCAILLCLSGGWPASAECNHARAVFIQRITPWPVEPPLQIWRCPMGTALNLDPAIAPSERLRDLAKVGAPLADFTATVTTNSAWGQGPIEAVLTHDDGNPYASGLFHRIAVEVSEENGTADIDVSGPEFDFIRSIRVWNVLHYSHAKRGRNDECREQFNIQLGTYGAQGEFRWAPSGSDPVPDFVISSRSCEPGSYARAVGVEWTDVEGKHGYEVVKY